MDRIVPSEGTDKGSIPFLDTLSIVTRVDNSSFLYKKLGDKIRRLSKYKDIYRINIDDEEVQKYINDIFYGFDMSNSDNELLDKKYYENISKDKYFSKYDDSIKMNFSKLNHIGISFKNGNCPLEFLEKVDWE